MFIISNKAKVVLSALALGMVVQSFASIAYADTGNAKIKSIPVNSSEVYALAKAVDAVEKAKTAGDRDAALKNLRIQVIAFDSSAARFAASLKANKEEKLFDDILLEKAKLQGSQVLAALKAADPSGIPSRIVSKPSFAKSELADFEKTLSPLSSFDWWQLIGISSAEAGFWSKVKRLSCQGSIWAISAGEGADASYKLCGT